MQFGARRIAKIRQALADGMTVAEIAYMYGSRERGVRAALQRDSGYIAGLSPVVRRDVCPEYAGPRRFVPEKYRLEPKSGVSND